MSKVFWLSLISCSVALHSTTHGTVRDSSALALLADDHIYFEAKAAYLAYEFERSRDLASSCSESSPDCAYLEAESNFILNPKTGFSALLELAESGNHHAQYLVGALYSSAHVTSTSSSSKPPLSSLAILHLYASSTAHNPLALSALGFRHLFGYSVPRKCDTSALYYVEVAKKTASVYSAHLPSAVELVRLSLPSLSGLRTARARVDPGEIGLFEKMAFNDPQAAHAVGKRYLLGYEGFPQDFEKAWKFLTIHLGHRGCLGLQGYILALGLGREKDEEAAKLKFAEAIVQETADLKIPQFNETSDPLALNGLGYFAFRDEDHPLAFSYFNASANYGSADGMFNLGSLYLSGLGTNQHFQKAFLWFSQALQAGHTPAGYALGIMQLNGLGTVRDCLMGVRLLKEVAERGLQVAATLDSQRQTSSHSPVILPSPHSFGSLNRPSKIAHVLSLIKLAEAGMEIAQQNLAWILEEDPELEGAVYGGESALFQRFYELSSSQSSAASASELKLGDLAFSGRGVQTRLENGKPVVSPRTAPDLSRALQHYRAVAGSPTEEQSSRDKTPPAAQSAAFALGYMHQFGFGVDQNLEIAGNFYSRAYGDGFLGWLAGLILSLHAWSNGWVGFRVWEDPRIAMLLTLLFGAVPFLLVLRRRVATGRVIQ